jgi:hypothetical protein
MKTADNYNLANGKDQKSIAVIMLRRPWSSHAAI